MAKIKRRKIVSQDKDEHIIKRSKPKSRPKTSTLSPINDEDLLPYFKDIFAKALKDRDFCIHLTQSKLKPDHLPRPYMKWFYPILKSFIDNPKYKSKVPSLKVFKDKIEMDMELDVKKKLPYYERIKELFSRPVQNEEYSLEVVERTIQYQEFKLTLEDTISKMGKYKDPNVAINYLINKSFKISNQNNNIQVVDLFDDVKNRQKQRLHIKKNPKKYKRFMFGLPSIDKCLPGGLMQPMLASIAAKTGRGKSIATIDTGWKAWKQGFNVTQITSENENSQTTGRYDSHITQFKYDDIQLANLSEEDNKKFLKTYAKFANKQKNKIKIVKMNPNDFTAATIFHALSMLEADGHKTDFLIIDSPDLMQSVAAHKDKRLQAAAIYWEVKALLTEKRCIGVVTTQLTKMSSDENPLAEDLSEAYDKSRLLDFLMILIQSKTHRANNEAILAIVKNRDGKLPKDFIYIITEFERMKFTEKPPEEELDDVDAPKKKKSGPDLKIIDGGNNSQLDTLRKIGKKKKKFSMPTQGVKKIKRKPVAHMESSKKVKKVKIKKEDIPF